MEVEWDWARGPERSETQDSGTLGSGKVVGKEGEDTEIWKQHFISGRGPEG